MREIRFRMWNTQRKKMYAESHSGLFIQMNSGRCGVFCDDHTFEDIPNILMQYTGLKDRNGKEIYEHDIVKYLDGETTSTESGMDCTEFETVGKVYWCDREHCWDIGNRHDVTREDAITGELEVIGNIYEHPDLLSPAG